MSNNSYSNDPKSFFDLEKVRAILAASQSTVLGRIKHCPEDQTDKARGCSNHNMEVGNKHLNFDQKIYWFPPHFNLLRQELFENWKTLWALVGWAMAFRAEMFIEYMNDALDMGLALDSDSVDWTCEQYLIELRRRRFAAMQDIKE